MHEYDETTDDLAWAVFRYALNRIRMDPPLDGPLTVEQLRDAVGQTITRDGLGGDEALAVFADHLAPACISADHPRYLAFVPGAPSEAAALFDLVVGASSFCGTSWLDVSGAVYAENQVLRWISDLAGMPAEAGGCFVSGGTMGNLSALVAARDQAGRRSGRPQRWAVVVADSVHSSVASAAGVMDVDVLEAGTDDRRRLHGAAVSEAIEGRPAGTEVFAVVATAGTTNLGVVDALDEVGERGRGRCMVPRRWRLRLRRSRRTVGPRPVRRNRARRFPGRRPAQMALRPLRLCGAHLQGSGRGPGRPHPARRLPGPDQRTRRVEPQRLCADADP